jgi:hypothetical protein
MSGACRKAEPAAQQPRGDSWWRGGPAQAQGAHLANPLTMGQVTPPPPSVVPFLMLRMVRQRGPKRNGGRHCCRPPLSLGPSIWPVKARPPFPGRFRPRPCGPGRSLRFRHRTSPDRSPAGPAPGPKAGHGSLAGAKISVLRLRYFGSLSDVRRSELRRSSFRGTFGPGASGFAGPSKESGFGFGLRRRLALLPSGCPGPRFDRLRSEDFHRSPRAVAESVFPFPEGRALPQDRNCQPFLIPPRLISGTRPVDNGDNGDNMG